MAKFRTSILIFGILITVVVASLLTVLVLYATGTLVTDPIELEYTLADANKIYDGTPLTADEYVLTSGEVLEGHTAKVEILGSQTGVGVGESDLTVKFYDEKGFDVSDEYAVKVNKGKLTVERAEITVTLEDQQVEYNGKQIDFEDYKVQGNLVAGHKVAGSVSDLKLVEAGEVLKTDVQPLIFDAQGNEVTHNYDVTFKMGKIEITKRQLTIRPVSKTKIYDGTPLLCNEYEVVSGSLAFGQTIELEYCDLDTGEASLTNADQKRIRIEQDSLRIYADQEEVTKNYEINCSETGLLTVEKRTLTLTAKSGIWEYDGTEHSFLTDKTPFVVEGLAPGEEIEEVNYKGKITAVGNETNTIDTFSLKNGRNADNYKVVKIDGTLQVTKKNLTVYTKSIFKTYDGNALNYKLEDKDLYETSPALPQGHVLEFDKEKDAFTKDLVRVDACSGSYILTVKAVKFNDDDVKDNFEISVVSGSYQIGKAVITATLSTSLNATYTGKTGDDGIKIDLSQAMSGVEIVKNSEDSKEPSLNLDLNWFEYTTLQPLVNAGKYNYNVRLKDAEKAQNFDLSIKDGVFEIKRLHVALAVSSDDNGNKVEAVYGTTDFFPSADALYFSENSNYEVVSATYEADVSNKIIKVKSATVKDSETGEYITDNLDISYANATYEISYTPRGLAFDIDSFTYTGDSTIRETEELRKSLVRVSGATPLAPGDVIEIVSTVKTGRNTFTVGEFKVYHVENGVKTDVTALYNCTDYGLGTIVID